MKSWEIIAGGNLLKIRFFYPNSRPHISVVAVPLRSPESSPEVLEIARRLFPEELLLGKGERGGARGPPRAAIGWRSHGGGQRGAARALLAGGGHVARAFRASFAERRETEERQRRRRRRRERTGPEPEIANRAALTAAGSENGAA